MPHAYFRARTLVLSLSTKVVTADDGEWLTGLEGSKIGGEGRAVGGGVGQLGGLPSTNEWLNESINLSIIQSNKHLRSQLCHPFSLPETHTPWWSSSSGHPESPSWNDSTLPQWSNLLFLWSESRSLFASRPVDTRCQSAWGCKYGTRLYAH